MEERICCKFSLISSTHVCIIAEIPKAWDALIVMIHRKGNISDIKK